MIYMVCPYHHDDPAVRVARHRAACRAVAALLRAGLVTYSPLAHNYELIPDLPDGWDFWARFERAHLARSTEVCVLPLDGWDSDPIVQATIAAARELGLPIRFLSHIEAGN